MSLFVTLLPREDSCLSISSALFSWLISEVINSPDSSLNLSTSFMWNCSPLSSFESILTFLSGSITVCTSLFSCVLTTVCSTFIVSSWSFIVSSTSLFMTVLPREDSCSSMSESSKPQSRISKSLIKIFLLLLKSIFCNISGSIRKTRGPQSGKMLAEKFTNCLLLTVNSSGFTFKSSVLLTTSVLFTVSTLRSPSVLLTFFSSSWSSMADSSPIPSLSTFMSNSLFSKGIISLGSSFDVSFWISFLNCSTLFSFAPASLRFSCITKLVSSVGSVSSLTSLLTVWTNTIFSSTLSKECSVWTTSSNSFSLSSLSTVMSVPEISQTRLLSDIGNKVVGPIFLFRLLSSDLMLSLSTCMSNSLLFKGIISLGSSLDVSFWISFLNTSSLFSFPSASLRFSCIITLLS